MKARQAIHGIELGSFGRVLFTGPRCTGLMRANDTGLWPATAITVVVVL